MMLCGKAVICFVLTILIMTNLVADTSGGGAKSIQQSGFLESIDPDRYPAPFILVKTKISNQTFTIDNWLPTIGNMKADTWSGNIQFRHAASKEWFWLTYWQKNLVSIKVSTTLSYDHTIYGYNYSPPSTGVMKPWSSYNGKPGTYSIDAWKNVTGILADTDGDGVINGADAAEKMSKGVNAVIPRTKIRLDFGSIDYGTLAIAAYNLDGSESNRTLFYDQPSGVAALTQNQLKVDLSSGRVPCYLYVDIDDDVLVKAIYNGGRNDHTLDQIKILQHRPVITFAAGPNGVLVGPINQVVKVGEITEVVGAVASKGYHFVRWEDANGKEFSIENPLALQSSEDLNLVAVFDTNPTAASSSGDQGDESKTGSFFYLMIAIALVAVFVIVMGIKPSRKQ